MLIIKCIFVGREVKVWGCENENFFVCLLYFGVLFNGCGIKYFNI